VVAQETPDKRSSQNAKESYAADASVLLEDPGPDVEVLKPREAFT